MDSPADGFVSLLLSMAGHPSIHGSLSSDSSFFGTSSSGFGEDSRSDPPVDESENQPVPGVSPVWEESSPYCVVGDVVPDSPVHARCPDSSLPGRSISKPLPQIRRIRYREEVSSDDPDSPVSVVTPESPVRADSPDSAMTEPPISKQSDKPWKKRKRWGEIPDSRHPSSGRKSPLEAAFRRCIGSESKNVIVPSIGLEFDSLPEAYDFYNIYSWEIVFGIRYGQPRSNVARCRISQEIVCGCQGKPRHQNTRSACCGCKAMIRLHRTDDNGWYIHEFREAHNHALSLSSGEKLHWPSHNFIDPHTKALVTNLRDNNVGLSNVYSVIGSFFGSMGNVPFNKRSLKSLCARISRDHSEDDVRKTYELLSDWKREDPNFVDSCLHDSDGKVRGLMWTNGKSRLQWKHFGDAITFDTTYRTKQYDMPFGLFVGVNNHFQSILFGGVLVTNENKETFEWVFKEFVSLMGGKAPATILTDQCRAMQNAIEAVLLGTTHRWCKWHVLHKAKEHLGSSYTKLSGFRDELHTICHHMYTKVEFEGAWAILIAKYGLVDNPFLTQIYEVREMWAKPYFAGKFCARMTSTQRSESANHMLKCFVAPGSSMNMFVRHYQKLQFSRDQEEDYQEKRCRLNPVLLNSGFPIELHASKIYTPNMFQLFSVEMFQAGSYIVREIAQLSRYTVEHIFAKKREAWSKVSFEVVVDPTSETLSCECGMYEHMGMLCCHSIRLTSVSNFQSLCCP